MATRRSNGEGSAGWITKNGQKYWRISITAGFNPLNGNQVRKDFYGKTQKEAKEKLRVYKETAGKAADASTLGAFFYEWLWNVKKLELKASSFERWEGIYRLYIQPNRGLNNAKLLDLDTVQLQKITNQLLKTHTVNQVRTMNNCIRGCLQYAVAANKIKNNPVINIAYPKNHNVEEEKVNYITETEQKALISALNGDECEAIILLGLMCGLRLGEAMALTKADIDFDNNIIKISKSVKYVWTGKVNPETKKKIYEYRLTVPKNKQSVREVPLPDIIVPMIKSLIKINKENNKLNGDLYFPDNLIFCNELGFYIDSKKPNRHLKSALKRASIKTDIHYHSLRHIFITNCISKDIGLKTVMDWVGHADVKTTMTIYAEINKEKNKKEYDKINSMFM